MRKPTKEAEDYIRENLRYDPETGHLWWTKLSPKKGGRVRNLNEPVGKKNKTTGYISFNLGLTGGQVLCTAHRAAWFLHYGVWPSKIMRHVNGVITDNRIENLQNYEGQDFKEQDHIDDYLKENLRYDPETGHLWWLKTSDREKRRKLDQPAGSNSSGYLIFKVSKRTFSAHRIAWFLHYGSWPKGIIDHINNIKHDNRIENLREVTHKQNLKNQKSRLKSSSKYKGVSFAKREKKWRVEMRVDRELTFLGYYDSEEEAARVYDKAAREVHGDYARLNFPEEHEQGATHGYDL